MSKAGLISPTLASISASHKPDPQPGPILPVTPDGSARVAAAGLAFPNGMVITPDGQTLIVAESHAARLTAFSIEPDVSLSHRRVWAQFEDRGDFREGQMTPDGICPDAEGAVWIASLQHKRSASGSPRR